MNKEGIMYEIRGIENSLEELKQELSRQRENYEILSECEEKNKLCVDSFEQSIENRRKQLKRYDYLRAVAKYAVGYTKMMQEELGGNDYQQAVNEVGRIEEILRSKKREVQYSILDLERQIQSMEGQLAEKWDAYISWEDESCQIM